MSQTLIQSILLAAIALIANFDFITGGTMISRPLVTGLLTGVVMGDITTGIIIGGTLELAFMGAFSIGAVIPPDTISGAILGTAFAISTGKGAEVALTLALPIASLVLLIKNLVHVFILPLFVNKADQYAEQGNGKGIMRINMVMKRARTWIKTAHIIIILSFIMKRNGRTMRNMTAGGVTGRCRSLIMRSPGSSMSTS